MSLPEALALTPRQALMLATEKSDPPGMLSPATLQECIRSTPHWSRY